MSWRFIEELVAKALEQLSKPAVPYPFAVPAAADELVKDIKGHPHAYVVACVMDRQMKAEKAWSIPYELQQRLGSFELPFLLEKSADELAFAMMHPNPLHRFNTLMAGGMYSALHRIQDGVRGQRRQHLGRQTVKRNTWCSDFLGFEAWAPRSPTWRSTSCTAIFA